MERNEDQKFIAAFGRDKTFADGLKGSLENCDELLYGWFLRGQVLAKKATQSLGGYTIEFRFQRGSKADPKRGYRAAFFDVADIEPAATSQKVENAALVLHRVEQNDQMHWRIFFPNETKIANAYTKLVNEIIRQRLKAD